MSFVSRWLLSFVLFAACAAPLQHTVSPAPHPLKTAPPARQGAPSQESDAREPQEVAGRESALEYLKEETQTFLDYYVLGATAPRAKVGFPGSSFAGIQFRAPAQLGIPPEYEPIPDPDDGKFVPAATDGPAGIGPYLFLDRCPLRSAKVSIDSRGIIMVELIFVVQYPPGRFPDPSVDQTVPVRLPTSTFNAIAMECISRLKDTIAFNPAVGFPVGYTVTVLDLRTFESQAQAQ